MFRFSKAPLTPQTDQSQRTNAGNFSLKEGNLQQMLACARMENGKVLNTLSFPMINAGIQNEAFSSDVAAWNKTLAEPICKYHAAMPVGDIRWGHCATRGAFEGFRINPHGLGMFIDVLHGLKWCILPSLVHEPTAMEFLFDDHDPFDMATMCHLEAVMLLPGTRL